jgi:hypothetical protein
MFTMVRKTGVNRESIRTPERLRTVSVKPHVVKIREKAVNSRVKGTGSVLLPQQLSQNVGSSAHQPVQADVAPSGTQESRAPSGSVLCLRLV